MRLVQRLLLPGFTFASPGCVGWRHTSLPAPEPDAPLRVGTARVTNIDGHTVELHSVVVSADSVAGWRAREPFAGQRLALHRSQVLSMEHSPINFVRTALAVLGFAAVALMQAISRGA